MKTPTRSSASWRPEGRASPDPYRRLIEKIDFRAEFSVQKVQRFGLRGCENHFRAGGLIEWLDQLGQAADAWLVGILAPKFTKFTTTSPLSIISGRAMRGMARRRRRTRNPS